MSSSEELREALLNLEKARKREAHERQMAEALVAGLRALLTTEDSNELFQRLFDVMRNPLDFERAFVLIEEEGPAFKAVASSDPLFVDTVWHPKAMFRRVMEGRPTAVFDTQLVEEWRSQPEAVRRTCRSALHFSIQTLARKAIFVCTHSRTAHFSTHHSTLAKRFSALASQALNRLESEARIANLEENLRAKSQIAELNRKLAESEKRLSQARKMEAIGLLAGGVAHDLNNILSGIVTYPELILMDLAQDSPLRRPIETIRDSGVRAAEVVADLLTIARRVATGKEVVNLNSIVKRHLESPEHKELERAHPFLHIETRLDPDLLNMSASPVHIHKTLMNLVTNACEAMNGSGTITLSTTNRYLDDILKGYEEVRRGEYVVLGVADEGAGILPQDLDRIFEPFYTKKVMGRSGTGLGLAVVWNTVQDHDGYVNVLTSERGTVFELYFPVTRENLTAETTRLSLEDYTGHGEKVLVVDDEERQREIACGILNKLGYRVEAVSGGEAAVEYVRQTPVDLIVLDMVMPRGMGGKEAYEEIIKIRPGQRAIIASGYAMTEDVETAQRLGAGQYIRKPYTLEKFGIAVRKELGRKGGIPVKR
ncbi:MAG: response regulator [Candidatus Desulfacyla sp.]